MFATDSSSSPIRLQPMADQQGIRLRPPVGNHANHRLQHRGGELECQRDQADLAEIEPVRILQNRVERRHQRLVHVVQQVTDRSETRIANVVFVSARAVRRARAERVFSLNVPFRYGLGIL